MASARVAVKIYRTVRSEHSAHLTQSRGHHGEVRHHVAVAQEFAERTDHITESAALFFKLITHRLCLLTPDPRVSKNSLLCRRPPSAAFLEKHAVILLAVERRIEVDEVYAFGCELSEHT